MLAHREQLDRDTRGSALAAAHDRVRVARAAAATEMQPRRPRVLAARVGIIALTDQLVDQDHALASLCLLERWPPRSGSAQPYRRRDFSW